MKPDVHSLPRSSVIVLGLNEWNDIWHTRQYVSAHLAQRGCRVVYSTGALSRHDIAGGEWLSRRWRATQALCADVTVVRSGRVDIRWARWPAWDRRVVARHATQLMRAAGWHGGRERVAYVFHPTFLPYLDHLESDRVVYHVDDAFSLMPEWTEDAERAQSVLVERADLVLASSAGMARLLPRDGPQKARILPNGAESERFVAARSQPCPEDLESIPHPRIGYVGSINLKVDLGLVCRIASLRPDWHWVLVGPRFRSDSDLACYAEFSDALARCHTFQNIHFVGPKSLHEIGAYVAHMDVNTMCYRTDPGGWWTDLSPLKLHEYLAVAKPVVSANLESVREFSKVVAIAEGTDQWVQAIEHALDNGGAGSAKERELVALANTWSRRVEQVLGWLESCDADRNATDTPVELAA